MAASLPRDTAGEVPWAPAGGDPPSLGKHRTAPCTAAVAATSVEAASAVAAVGGWPPLCGSPLPLLLLLPLPALTSYPAGGAGNSVAAGSFASSVGTVVVVAAAAVAVPTWPGAAAVAAVASAPSARTRGAPRGGTSPSPWCWA